MPCESCNVQFTVFRRKRLCTECRRFYCNHCLVKRRDKILCERCVVLTARPLSKVDLLKLKPKDLIFYLQSKHISTTGCVEKEELVNLVMTHVNTTSDSRSSHSSSRSSPQHAATDTATNTTASASAAAPEDATNADYENCSNPFDQIKQTCQNLFSSFADKIVDFNFENKPTANPAANAQPQANVFNQPRFQTREMPSYASSAQHRQQQQVPNVQPPPPATTMPRSNSSTTDLRNTGRAAQSQSTSSSNPSSPIVSLGSVSSSHGSSMPATAASPASRPGNANMPTVHQSNLRRFIDNVQDVNASGCECSDDEVLAEFTKRRNSRTDPGVNLNLAKPSSPPSQTDSAFDEQIPGPSGSGAHSAASSSQLSSGENPKSSEESSASSFEELGAVGGGGGGSSGAAANEWQIVDKADVTQASQPPPSSSTSSQATFPAHSTVTTEQTTEHRKAPHKPRRLNRRRSDSCMVHQSSSSRAQDELPNAMDIDESDDPDDENLSSCKRSRKCCHKCGKTKNNLKSKLMKFRRQLDTEHMSEAEIKREIEDFLNYLESKAKDSFDCSDSENHGGGGGGGVPQVTIDDVSESMGNRGGGGGSRGAVGPSEIAISRDYDGIHVYGSRVEDDDWRHNGRFLNLGDFKSRSELEDLSVKQLKEILMLNRVDFKGCCEKQELLERVHRLWDDLQTSPAVDRLPTDDLCKICMDAPIECVILECGHVATCTNCGKVLSECPICRQYIVRVVRFFRA